MAAASNFLDGDEDEFEIYPAGGLALCEIKVRYRASKDGSYKNILNSQGLVSFEEEMDVCNASTFYRPFNPILESLQLNGALQRKSGEYQGEFFHVLYESVLLSEDYPGLYDFEGESNQENWRTFASRYLVDSNSPLTISTHFQALEICQPETLEISVIPGRD